ncbi:MAG TPA: CIA30 family protein [Gammaproteobacteria bacterium]|nr:CIA30 family protein [Gammaproteobacteria bacterium]
MARNIAILFVAATLALAVPVAASAAGTPHAQNGNSFAVKNVRVFDGTRVIDDATVVVRNGLIQAVGHDASIPDGMVTYDGAGKTLLPGLIDAHVHTYGRSRRNALRLGVTTELDMFTDWRLIAQARIQRESLARVDRADMWSAGTLATVPHGHGTEYSLNIPTLTEPGQAQQWVDDRIAEGSDYIKIIMDDGSAYKHLHQVAVVIDGAVAPSIRKPTLSPATIKALIKAAHKRGKMAVIHIASLRAARIAVEGGVDGLAHVFVDKVAKPDFIHFIKQHGTFVISTLSVYSAMACGDEAGNLRYDSHIEPFLSQRQHIILRQLFAGCFPDALNNAKKNIGLLKAAGVPILAGTDAGEPGVAHGASLHGELKLLVEAGLTPIEALTAATSAPAHYFHLNDRGRIAPGLRADLLLVNGDPTKNIRATRAIAVIWKNGYTVDRRPPAWFLPAQVASPLVDLVSNFDNGKISSQYGYGWHVMGDRRYGGFSSAKMSLSRHGANGSAGALRVTGTVESGFAFPFAGAMFFPAKHRSDQRDFSNKHSIAFWARGDGRVYSVMLFSGSVQDNHPVMEHFKAGPGWRHIQIPLAAFEGADIHHVRGIAFTAGPETGDFNFEIDDVELK